MTGFDLIINKRVTMREMWNFHIQRLIGNIRAGTSSLWCAVNSERLTELLNSGIVGLSSKKQLITGLFGSILRYNQTNSLQIDQELQELEELGKLWLQIGRDRGKRIIASSYQSLFYFFCDRTKTLSFSF